MTITLRYAQEIPDPIPGPAGEAGADGAAAPSTTPSTTGKPIYLTTAGTRVVCNLNRGSSAFRITASADFELQFIGGSDGRKFSVSITESTGVPVTVTYINTIRWANGGTEPTIADAINKRTVLGFEKWVTGNSYDGFVIGQDI